MIGDAVVVAREREDFSQSAIDEFQISRRECRLERPEEDARF